MESFEEFKEIAKIISKTPLVQPPGDLTARVMARVEAQKVGKLGQVWQRLVKPYTFSIDIRNIAAGTITSYKQLAFLLFFFGTFYLITSLFVLWGIGHALKYGQIALCLKLQPFFALFNSLLLILLGAGLMIFKHKFLLISRNAIIVQIAFVSINAFMLELMLVLPIALISTLLLAVIALLAGIMLINSVQTYIKTGLFKEEGYNCV